jgi:hypothetical protein
MAKDSTENVHPFAVWYLLERDVEVLRCSQHKRADPVQTLGF